VTVGSWLHLVTAAGRLLPTPAGQMEGGRITSYPRDKRVKNIRFLSEKKIIGSLNAHLVLLWGFFELKYLDLVQPFLMYFYFCDITNFFFPLSMLQVRPFLQDI